EAEITVTLARQVKTKEGHMMRRFEELPLARSRSPLFALSWTVMHPIVKGSPLKGKKYNDMLDEQFEILVVLSGTDETFSDKIYARHSYLPDEIVFNQRFQDIISIRNGRRHVDLSKFHETCDDDCVDDTGEDMEPADEETS